MDNQTLFNENKAKAVRELGITETFYDKLIHAFIQELTDATQALRQALTDTDVESLRRIIHTLKGSAGNLRIENIYQLTSHLDESLKHSTIEPAELRKAVEQLRRMCEELKQIFK